MPRPTSYSSLLEYYGQSPNHKGGHWCLARKLIYFFNVHWFQTLSPRSMNESVLNISTGNNEIPLQGAHFAGGGEDQWAQVTRNIAKNGDRVAFAKYYEAFFDTMFLTVKRATGCDESTCLDIVQDAMVKAILKMKAMDSREQTAAWTKVVAKTTAWDFLRRQARQKKLSESLLNSGEACEAKIADIDSEARIRWIEEQLLQLPADLRSMISMKYRMGWTLRQIGEKLGLKTGAVDGKIRRTIDDLKTRALKEFEDE